MHSLLVCGVCDRNYMHERLLCLSMFFLSIFLKYLELYVFTYLHIQQVFVKHPVATTFRDNDGEKNKLKFLPLVANIL